MVNKFSNVFWAGEAPDARFSCRICGMRIKKGEPTVRYVSAQLYYVRRIVVDGRIRWEPYPGETTRRAVHISCLYERDTGVDFLRSLIEHTPDEYLVEAGLMVEAEATAIEGPTIQRASVEGGPGGGGFVHLGGRVRVTERHHQLWINVGEEYDAQYIRFNRNDPSSSPAGARIFNPAFPTDLGSTHFISSKLFEVVHY